MVLDWPYNSGSEKTTIKCCTSQQYVCMGVYIVSSIIRVCKTGRGEKRRMREKRQWETGIVRVGGDCQSGNEKITIKIVYLKVSFMYVWVLFRDVLSLSISISLSLLLFSLPVSLSLHLSVYSLTHHSSVGYTQCCDNMTCVFWGKRERERERAHTVGW